MQRGLVHLDVGDGNIEIWLVSNPREVQQAFEAAVRSGVFAADSPLDEAADLSRDPLTLQAMWGTDIPLVPDEAWLTQVLATTRETDREEVRFLVVSQAWGREA